MEICKKYWLKYQINKYGKFLLKEGIIEAKRRKKNIHIGLQGKLIVNEDPLERIYLPESDDGEIDISPIISLGAENNPKEARKYVVYSKMLNRMYRL